MTEITLGTCLLNGDEVQKVVEMKFLRKLEISWIESVPIEPIIVACSRLEVLVLKCEHRPSPCDYLYKWINAGFTPPNLNVVNGYVNPIMFLQRWPQWNSQIPAGHTAHFKAFSSKNYNWLNSFVAFPDFHLEFGQNATYPFIKPSNFGLFGFGEDLMVLNHSTINGKLIHQLKKPYIQSKDYSLVTNHLCYNVTNLNFVTDFDASNCGLLSDHLEQISVSCPNLKQLDLKGNVSCLESLKGQKVL